MDFDHEVVYGSPRDITMSDSSERPAERARFVKFSPLLKGKQVDMVFSPFVDLHGCMSIFLFIWRWVLP
jgi:hypothetical protein